MCNNLDIRYRLKKDLFAAMQPLSQKLIAKQKELTIAIQKPPNLREQQKVPMSQSTQSLNDNLMP